MTALYSVCSVRVRLGSRAHSLSCVVLVTRIKLPCTRTSGGSVPTDDCSGMGDRNLSFMSGSRVSFDGACTACSMAAGTYRARLAVGFRLTTAAAWVAGTYRARLVVGVRLMAPAAQVAGAYRARLAVGFRLMTAAAWVAGTCPRRVALPMRLRCS